MAAETIEMSIVVKHDEIERVDGNASQSVSINYDVVDQDDLYTWKPIVRVFKKSLSLLGFTYFDWVDDDQFIEAIDDIIREKSLSKNKFSEETGSVEDVDNGDSEENE